MRRALIALAAMLIAGTALAQDSATVEACRLDADRVAVRVSFWGGACVYADPPVVEAEGADGTATLTVGTRETAEICTKQLVQLESVGVVALGEDVARVDVAVQGGASASADIAPASRDCVEPGSEDTK